MENSLKKIVTSMIWRFGERILAQVVTFVVSVVLARLLSPADYGNITLLMIFIELADVFVVHGFGTALVQKKDADNGDFSSVFFFSLGFTAVLYVVVFFASPILGVIFDSPTLPNLFRVLALRIPLSGINSVQHAYVQRKMVFKRFFFATLGGTLGSAVLGISLAYAGFGAWALVAQYLGNSLCDTVILWVTVKWRPEKRFSWKKLKGLLDFGWKMLGSQLIHVVYNRLSSFVIGTAYSTADLAYYEQGSKIPGVVETNIDTTINSVLFPAMSKAQDDPTKLKIMVRRSIRTSAIFIWPLMIGLMVMSTKLVELVYTSKWLPCVFFMQIACIRLAIEPIQTANLQAIKALGRSDLYIKMEIVKKGYGLLILILTSKISIKAIAVGVLSQSIFSFVVNAIPNRSLLKYPIIEQLQDVFPSAIIATIMGGIVYVIGNVLPDTLAVFITQILIGVVVYGVATYIFRREDFNFIFGLVKSMLGRK